jgi:hypothetical protein
MCQLFLRPLAFESQFPDTLTEHFSDANRILHPPYDQGKLFRRLRSIVGRSVIGHMNSRLMLAASLLCFCGAASAQLGRGGKRALTFDDILACSSGPSAKLLGQSADKIRETDYSRTQKLPSGIVIHWSLSGDPQAPSPVSEEDGQLFESSGESGFCRNGMLRLRRFNFLPERYVEANTGKVVELPQGSPPPRSDEKTRWIHLSESKLFVTEIERDGQGYNFSLEQVQSGNHEFSQKRGVFTNSDQQYLLVTLDPVPCSLTLRDDEGNMTTAPLEDRSKIGVSLQWAMGKEGHWSFYRAMYDKPGCPEGNRAF